jgi:hypothetical protein
MAVVVHDFGKERIMRSKSIFGILLVAFALAGIGVWAHRTFIKAETAPVVTPVDASTKAVVYYFRTNYRCPTCMKLEAYTRGAVEKYFADEVKRGEVAFVMLNVEEKANEHFIGDYGLKTKSVVLVSPAKKDRWKNLDQIWKRVGDESGYTSYIRDELKGFLAGLD